MIRFIYFQFAELKVFERVDTCTLSFFLKVRTTNIAEDMRQCSAKLGLPFSFAAYQTRIDPCHKTVR